MRHACVEVEAVTSAHPPLENDQWLLPVRAICALYRGFGYGLLLVTATVESAEDLSAVIDALDTDDHVVVALQAERDTLRRRIIDREPETFTALDTLIAAAARLSAVVAELEGIALTLSTEGRRPVDVAAEIREAFYGALEPERT